MAERTIRLGLIGAGRMGVTHFSILGAHPDVKITAVAETSSVVNSLLEKYLGVNTYKDYARMIADEPLEGLLVCTPPSINDDILRRAADRGLHAFVEKPYTTSYAEALAHAERYEGKGLVGQVGYVNRFNDVFRKARALVESGVVGKVIRFRSEMHSRTIIRPEEGTGWRASHAQGGGAVYEMASHSIDLMNFLFGAPDRVIGTSLASVFSKNVEDVVSSTFLYRDGKVGSLYVNWSDESYRKPTNKIEIFGTGGKIFADQHGLKVYLAAPEPKGDLKPGWNQLYITDVFSNVPFFVRGIEFTAQLYHFIDCIKGGTRSQCSFRDGAATLGVIDAMFKDHSRNSVDGTDR